MFRILLPLILCYASTVVWAGDELREMQYAEQIEAAQISGELVYLQSQQKSFLALYGETEQQENLGTAIILHPMGGHPNQQNIINLRSYLAKHNWAILAIQLPVLEFTAKESDYYVLFDQAKARIQAGVDYLLSAEAENIILIGYGLGGLMALDYAQENLPKKDIKALVSISLPVPDSKYKKLSVIDFIGKIDIPMLDLYSEYDLPEVTETARIRRLAAKQNPAYQQFKLAAGNPLFAQQNELLVKRVYSWINKTFRD